MNILGFHRGIDPAPLTSEMHKVLAQMKQANRPPFHQLDPLDAKALYLRGADVLEITSPQMSNEETIKISSFDGALIEIKIFTPPITSKKSCDHSLNNGALIYFHGGGFTIGSIQTHSILCKEIAAQTQLCVFSVEYRLAPEFKFPTAHLDSWASCAWIYDNCEKLNISADRIFIGGDSAGGTLSLFCTQQAAIQGYKVKGQVLFYPGCSPEQNMQSHQYYASGYLLESDTIEYFYGQYLRNIQDRFDWRFSALNSPYLKLLPPTWIGLAECDPLRDEGLALNETLNELGCKSVCRVYAGVVHGFIKMGRFIPQAINAHTDACAFIKNLD